MKQPVPTDKMIKQEAMPLSDLIESVGSPSGLVLGRWQGDLVGAMVLVCPSGESQPERAYVMDGVDLSPGCGVLMAYPNNSAFPVIVGTLAHLDVPPDQREVKLDGSVLAFEADREVLIKCGKASIQLTRDGKVRIRGTDILSRSSGGQRIKGGRVNIN
ncbi:MAG: hypothetical protein KDC35_13520 [Acidobacteria bacterium]|nr:hypothetical protein [Acidobacteriota bacterium]